LVSFAFEPEAMMCRGRLWGTRWKVMSAGDGKERRGGPPNTFVPSSPSVPSNGRDIRTAGRISLSSRGHPSRVTETRFSEGWRAWESQRRVTRWPPDLLYIDTQVPLLCHFNTTTTVTTLRLALTQGRAVHHHEPLRQ
jgi:hypothetical protein